MVHFVPVIRDVRCCICEKFMSLLGSTTTKNKSQSSKPRLNLVGECYFSAITNEGQLRKDFYKIKQLDGKLLVYRKTKDHNTKVSEL